MLNSKIKSNIQVFQNDTVCISSTASLPTARRRYLTFPPGDIRGNGGRLRYPVRTPAGPAAPSSRGTNTAQSRTTLDLSIAGICLRMNTQTKRL